MGAIRISLILCCTGTLEQSRTIGDLGRTCRIRFGKVRFMIGVVGRGKSARLWWWPLWLPLSVASALAFQASRCTRQGHLSVDQDYFGH